MYMYMYIELYFVAREIDPTDGSQTYTLVGVVNGNPKGCRAERDFPDYHTSIGNAEVCTLYTQVQGCLASFLVK